MINQLRLVRMKWFRAVSLVNMSRDMAIRFLSTF